MGMRDLIASCGHVGKLLSAGILSVTLLAGCQQLGAYQNTQTFAPSPSIAGEHVFVYSLMDFNRDIVGYKLLREFDPFLVSGFTAASLPVKMAHPSFGSLDSIRALVKDRTGRTAEESTWLDVITTVVAAHRDEEIAFGATYRLIIAPTHTTTYATTDGITRVGMSGGNYLIRWALVDIVSNRTVWTSEYTENNSGHQNDRYVERAQNWVDGAIQELRTTHLLPAAPEPK